MGWVIGWEPQCSAREGHHHLLGGVWLCGGHQRIPAVIIDGVTLHHSKDRNLDRDVGILGSLGGEKLTHPLEVALPSGSRSREEKADGAPSVLT